MAADLLHVITIIIEFVNTQQYEVVCLGAMINKRK